MLKDLILISLCLLLVSCGIGLSPNNEIADLKAAEKAATEGIEITFHGDSCDVDYPDKLPVGEYHFILNDLSQLTSSALYVSRITNGHVFQDLLDIQGTPGKYHLKPDWLIYAKKMGSVDSSTGQKSYDVTLESGEHAIYVYGYQPTGEEWLWFCDPIVAVELPDS